MPAQSCTVTSFARPVLTCFAIFSTVAACGSNENTDPMLTEITAQGRVDAAGKLIGPNGNDMGVVAFTEGPYGTIIRLDVSGLAPGWHGIHLHKVGDCSDGADGFKASGGHVNPDGFAHGLLNPEGNHRADLVNIYAGTDGRVTAELYREGVNLLPSEAAAAENGPFPLLDEDGFAVIIHENEDDHMTQPIGGAGGRVACAALTE